MNPEEFASFGETICVHLAGEILKLGFPDDKLPPFPVYANADFASSKDPYSGEDSLIGTWRDGHGYRVGEIKLHGDGTFYAEYDVSRPHPSNARWFVEAVVAWGRDGTIKSEARLLPALV